MLTSKLNDKSNDSKDDGVEFIKNTTSSNTLFITTCSLQDGGCHSCGEDLAKALQKDHIGVSYNSEFDIRIFKQKIKSPAEVYETICITGCKYDKPAILNKIIEQYGASPSKVYLVVPPHNILEDYQAELTELKESYALECNGDISLIRTGIDINASHTIGLPSPITNLSTTDSKKVVSEQCYGLMYLRGFTKKNANSVLAWMNDEEDDSMTPKEFLSLYFSQISKIANAKSESAPSVIIVSADITEKKIISDEAKKFGVKLSFVDKLPAEDFLNTLKNIGDKGGIVASNGVQTLIQSALLNCLPFHFASQPSNLDFLNELVNAVATDLQNTAKVILGLSNQVSLLDDHDIVKKTQEAIQTILKASVAKFEQTKHQADSELQKSTDSKPTEITSTSTMVNSMKLDGLPVAIDDKSITAIEPGPIQDAKTIDNEKSRLLLLKELKSIRPIEGFTSWNLTLLRITQIIETMELTKRKIDYSKMALEIVNDLDRNLDNIKNFSPQLIAAIDRKLQEFLKNATQDTLFNNVAIIDQCNGYIKSGAYTTNAGPKKIP